MTMDDIIRLRLYNQRLADKTFGTAEEAVRWFGAVQSQDFGGAAWAVSQRLAQPQMAALNRAFAAGAILRTHVLRPTWHFVAAEDIRWMLDLSRPHLETVLGTNYRKLGLDEATLKRSNEIIVAALQDGNELTRSELATALRAGGIDTGDTVRLSHLVFRAETDALICSGVPRGKQQTYASLEKRAPGAATLPPAEAAAALAKRYFQSHGPATLKDFAWWSGLGVTQATAGLRAVQAQFASEEVDGKTFWFDPTVAAEALTAKAEAVHLLANYDEFTVAYADRSMLFDTKYLPKLDSRQNSLFTNVILIRGRIMGTWRRTLKAKSVTVEPNLFEPLTAEEKRSLLREVARYGEHLGLEATLK